MTKEYLQGYFRCSSFIKSINEEIHEVSVLKEVIKRYVDHEEVAYILDARERKLNKLLKVQEAKKAEIEAAVQAIPDETFRKLIFLRYIKGMDWEKLSYEMKYSYSHCFGLHAKFFKLEEGESK